MGMRMGIARWEWEGTGIKNPFPNTSSLKHTAKRFGDSAP